MILVLCLIPLALYGWLMQYGHGRSPVDGPERVVVEIPKGSSVRQIGRILGDSGLIDDDFRFLLLARWEKVATRLRAGEFQLPYGKTPIEILHLLATAKPYHYAITVPEGLRGTQIAEIFAANGWCDPTVFQRLMTDSQLLTDLGLGAVPSVEGYLYPDTYFLTRDMRGARTIITLLVRRFQQVWSEITRDLDELPDERETVILASIVEKETGAAAERPLIASVFMNRLRTGMKLQSDPTVMYGSGDFVGPITKAQLQAATPYNTYVIPALPTGPIANPGKDALLAVLHPARADYLYFVSKNDGTHYFSTTLREHINAVNTYQRPKGHSDESQ